jgi:hypothetical protein
MLVALMSLSLFVFCMVCHGELVSRRPPVRHLTLFYLMLSIGGALGGICRPAGAGDVQAYFELPIGLFLCALLVTVVLWRELAGWRMAAAGRAAGLRRTVSAGSPSTYVENYRVVVRNFYGQLRVDDVDEEEPRHQAPMLHGRINHGEQFLAAEHRRKPTAYYCEDSGVGRALFAACRQERPLKLGMLGLGAAYLGRLRPRGDEMRIYEINEQVLDLARNEFSYLAR